jgi:hypothetical protein
MEVVAFSLDPVMKVHIFILFRSGFQELKLISGK